ncbi:hypothetical protein [Streptomyces sp. NPDC008125]|uniref:hypothetical protein n=1 Tax=Streptomyces sp. NPDC008125 TaxID=3364811 RepID=UPI0036E2A565
MAEFARGFRLHPARDGVVLDGCEFPDGRVLVMDDPDYVLTTAAPSLDALLRGGYHGARVEWPGDGCPDCADYRALKARAESPEAAVAPLTAPADRSEPTARERVAAALFEQHQRQPWAMAYPADIEEYGWDADTVLAVCIATA